MCTYGARVEIHSLIYRINGSLARFLSHKSRSSSLFSFLSIHPSYISFHNRLPTHPSPPSTPQNHVSTFLTCIHRVRSDHSHKSQVLASLPSSAPDLTQRAGRPVSFAKPVYCDPGRRHRRRRPSLAARLARASRYVHVLPPHHATVSRITPSGPHQHRGPPHAHHRGRCADAPCTWRAFVCAASACCLSVVPSRRARQRWG